ncbi:MAG: hypothetical protein II994_01975 [Lachnospiraceae bacterium]|nr:hypothetical protein [Lachnospiraceae bacterium]
MKKKMVLMLMACVMTVSLVSCGQNPENSGVNDGMNQEQNGTDKNDGESVELGTLISRICQSTEEEFNSQEYYVNLPSNYGYENYLSPFAQSFALDTDESIILAQQYDTFTPVSGVEEVFTTYCAEVVEALNDNGHRNAANFFVGSTENVEINGLSMCKHKGICQYYDADNNVCEEKFVAYAAPTSNGSYGFFIVMGTNGAQVEADALYVATTYRETEEISEEIISKLSSINSESIAGAEEGWGEILPWEIKEVSVPAVEPLVWQEVATKNGRTTKVATTPLNFTFEQVKEILARHDVIGGSYNLFDYNTINVVSNAEGEVDMVAYSFTDQLLGMKKGASFDEVSEYFCDFTLTMNRNTSDFTNCNNVSIHFSSLAETQESQEKVKALLTELFGTEIAEYLVYTECDGESEDEGVFAYGDGAEYILKTSRNKYGTTFTVGFNIPLTHERLAERVYNYDGGYEPVTDTVKYNFSELTGGLFADLDVTDFRNYENEYLSLGDGVHVYAEPTVTYETMQLNATDILYRGKMSLRAQKEEWIARNCPYHTIDAEVVEDAEGVKSIQVSYEVENTWDEKVSFETVADLHLAQLQALFPEAELSAVTYDALKADDVQVDLGKVTILDKECQCIAVLDDSKEWTMSITWNRE